MVGRLCVGRESAARRDDVAACVSRPTARDWSNSRRGSSGSGRGTHPGAASVVTWLETTLDEPALSLERLAVDPERPNLVATLPGQPDHALCLNDHLRDSPGGPSVQRRRDGD